MFCVNVLCFVFLFYGLCFRFFVTVLGFVIVFYALCLYREWSGQVIGKVVEQEASILGGLRFER